ncbi:hypothetical protein Pcinc_023345 [Petrolisthes cinctipes]|uniref:Uncharacterized protein n=1 Tax=Petrolisthes cinctipes TaxID=88211 RepID=A0AAE1FC02_PETCI|nr:hypothetical protein Pcinc_023345 [Petrolisthes cinctipes]
MPQVKWVELEEKGEHDRNDVPLQLCGSWCGQSISTAITPILSSLPKTFKIGLMDMERCGSIDRPRLWELVALEYLYWQDRRLLCLVGALQLLGVV